jgi:membrane fusion protein, multidrug efflux system
MTSPSSDPNRSADGVAALPADETTGRRWLTGILIGATVVIAAGLAFAWRFHGRESTDDARIEGHVRPVAARVGGPVLEVRVHDNQEVAAGDVLAVIDPRDYELAVRRAEATLAEAEAAARVAGTGAEVANTGIASRLAGARSRVAAAEARRVAAKAREVEATATAERAATDRRRLEPLLAKDEVSRQEFDAADAAARATAAALDVARAMITEAERGLEAARAELDDALTAPARNAVEKAKAETATARADQARIALDQARSALGDTTVRAAEAGVVSRRSVEVGQVVAPGQPLLALVSLDDVWVVANFKESQLAGMRSGQPVGIRVDAFDGRRFRGHVDSLAAATESRFSLLPADNASGNFVKVVQRVPVKIVLEPGENQEHLLRPGLSVVPTVDVRADPR